MLSRIRFWCGSLLVAGVVSSGCCWPGSPYCQNNYPNSMGYTYPNWSPRPLDIPPNGPPDGTVTPVLGGPHVLDNSGTNGTTSSVLNQDNWTARSEQPNGASSNR
ncbi:MAG: hypothetical protein N2C12_00075 [Planctomycetales bacterium]